MYAFVILIGLGLGLGVAMGMLEELVPVKAPKALSRTVGALIAIGAAYVLDYSVFRAFGQELRSEWLHPVATGIVLVGFADLVRAVVGRLTDSGGTVETSVPTGTRTARAA